MPSAGKREHNEPSQRRLLIVLADIVNMVGAVENNKRRPKITRDAGKFI